MFAGRYRKLASKAAIAMRVRSASREPEAEGVQPLNADFFTLQKMGQRTKQRKALK